MKAKYAVKALLFLAKRQHNGPTLIADLARQENIPRKFLEAILLQLKNSGLLQSQKGKGGGYTLAISPRQITVGKAIEVFDGPLAAPACVTHSVVRSCDMCEEAPTCGLRLVMDKVGKSVAASLLSMTLEDVLSQVQASAPDPQPTYYI